VNLERIVIVLVGTLASGNIGSAARAMRNMGVSQLRLVNPQCSLDEQAYWMATCGAEILKNAQIVSSLREAIADCAYSFGTTARNRRWRRIRKPKDMAKKALSLSGENNVALVFGPEDTGLTNEELELCSEVVTIPTATDGSSLNIAQAVMILCYELFTAAEHCSAPTPTARLAPAAMTEAMYDHMRTTLYEIGFLNRQNPEYTLGLMRRILTKAALTIPEARFIRGIFRQLAWYVKSRSQKSDGGF